MKVRPSDSTTTVLNLLGATTSRFQIRAVYQNNHYRIVE